MHTADKPKQALVLDVGTSMLKACVVDANGSFLSCVLQRWSCTPQEGVPSGLEFQPRQLAEEMLLLGARAVKQAGGVTDGLIVSTQRLGFVFLDDAGHAIAGLPNIDRRAAQEALAFRGETGLQDYAVTGRWPGAQHLIVRLRWWRRYRPDVFGHICHIVSIGDYLTGYLTGKFLCEPTTACETGLLDVQQKEWSAMLLHRETLEESWFGLLRSPGSCAGLLREEAARVLELPQGTPVLVGGGDTQLGVLGAGGVNRGDMAVVAGTSAPVNVVVDEAVSDPEYRLITNPHVAAGKWVLEANAMLTGTEFQWIKDLLWENTGPAGFQCLNDMAENELKREGKLASVTMLAGASVANARRGNLYPQGVISFAMEDINAGRITRDALALSAFETAVYAILSNVELLSRRVGKPDRLIIGGGETKLPLFIRMLAALAQVPVYQAQGEDLTCLGAAMLAFVGLGCFRSAEAAVKKMARLMPVQTPPMIRQQELAQRMKNWNDAFDRFAIR